MVFQNKVPWEIAEGVGLCLSILFIYKWIHLVLQPKWQKIQLAQYKLMERLNSYIWIKGNIRVNVIITTLQRNEWVMKKNNIKKPNMNTWQPGNWNVVVRGCACIEYLCCRYVLLCHSGDVQSCISCWADEAQGQMQTSASLPTALTTPRLRGHWVGNCISQV